MADASALLGYLRDVAQGASNTAASNVSGPVDIIAWLLRKGGVPVPENALGSSQWMAEHGLTAQPKNALAGMAGETLGMVGPMLAAAKAPQIANALNRVGENAAMRQTLNPQTGAVVWHGSPHMFDQFDAAHIGKGEGAQAYGYGLYLADAPEVGGQYARMHLTGPANVAHVAGRNGGDAMAALRRAYPGMPAQWYESAIRKGADAGNLYKVDLPDEHIAKMLDWDKPLSQQAPEVQEALAKTKNKQLRAVVDYASSPYSTPGLEGEVKTMGEAIKLLGMNASPAKGSATLAKQGIPGIRYLDGGSRGAGAGTSNYVVFPGNENLLRILERNGVTIGQ